MACMTHLCVIRSWDFAGELTVYQSMVDVKSESQAVTAFASFAGT